MTGNAPLRLLLGPQRPDVTIAGALARSGIGDAPIGVISAAWQEAEGDIDDIRQVVASPATDLHLYHRPKRCSPPTRHCTRRIGRDRTD